MTIISRYMTYPFFSNEIKGHKNAATFSKLKTFAKYSVLHSIYRFDMIEKHIIFLQIEQGCIIANQISKCLKLIHIIIPNPKYIVIVSR